MKERNGYSVSRMVATFILFLCAMLGIFMLEHPNTNIFTGEEIESSVEK